MEANSITYHGKQLLEGPLNYFKLTCGPWPSFGFFRMRKVDVDAILAAGGTAGDLVFTDGTIDKATGQEWTITLGGIYLVKSTTIDTLEQEICDIVLADARVLWQYVYGAKDFNTYLLDRTTGRDVDGERDFELTNLNGVAEWTFDEVFTDLLTTLGLTEGAGNDYLLDYPAIARKPRNIIGKNVPVPKALERLLADALCFLAVDLVSEPGSSCPFYDIYALGAAEESADLNIITNNIGWLHKERLTQLNPRTSRGDTAKMIVAASSGTKLADAGSAVGVGGSGQKLLPSPYAIFGTEENTDFLKAVGDEVADEYKQSFQNEWRDSIYAGIIDFRLCRAIHEITWQSTAKGAFTRIKSYRPCTVVPHKDTNFAYSDYWAGGGGGEAKKYATITVSLNRGDVMQGIEEQGLYKIRLEGSEAAAWETGHAYVIGDVVSVTEDDTTTYYECTKAHTSNMDDKTYKNSTFWKEVEIDLDAGVLHYVGDLLQTIPWFQVDDIVEVVYRPPAEEEEEGPSWFILGTVTRTEKIVDGERHYSMLWNQDEKRAMAVFG